MEWLKLLGEEEIVLPGFVMMELMQGCRNKAEQNRIEKIVTSFAIVWPLPDSCNVALSLFANYHLSHDVGLLDVLIAQTAVSLNLPLYTFNQKHYSMIPGLTIIEPYKRV